MATLHKGDNDVIIIIIIIYLNPYKRFTAVKQVFCGLYCLHRQGRDLNFETLFAWKSGTHPTLPY